jgi:hypothetical protein
MPSETESLRIEIVQYRDRCRQFGADEAATALNRVLAMMARQAGHHSAKD